MSSWRVPRTWHSEKKKLKANFKMTKSRNWEKKKKKTESEFRVNAEHQNPSVQKRMSFISSNCLGMCFGAEFLTLYLWTAPQNMAERRPG